RVLSAMQQVPRHEFVMKGERHLAYQDQALGIDCQQTISQPYIVAAMSQALELSSDHHVLEIGTGSGYQAAVLAELSGRVISIERHQPLHEAAAERLTRLGYENIELLLGDGSQGHLPAAPFERIMITAAGRELPNAIWEQLAEGGILVAPLGEEDVQQLTRIVKRQGRPVSEILMDCRFVPLVTDAT
ncbi:MAG: protein-L-isoaspartate(D-aspartate) O-methyltransferase, partial [Planctomycetaceae bacterium]|nr:protein-L-isoaspartate(D-aspartate) O-methyltransferase [Planctomycetaceae bacterium]